ncbi:MAG: hypothetical protein R2724_00450 [Bryobacterales bacterium]
MVLVFDVNETLLDLSALDPHFERLFGDESVRSAWFTQVLQTAMTLTLTRKWRTSARPGEARYGRSRSSGE